MAVQPNIDQLEAIIQQLAAQIAQLEAEVERLKQLLQAKADAKAAKPPTFPENYSLTRNPRTRRKKKRKSPGRTPHSAKRELAAHEVAIYAPGVSPEACLRHRSQFAWRILDGKAVYVCYHIYDVPESRQLPVPPGLRTSRSEFGIEIILIVAFLHYWIGVSLDNVRQILAFFTGLPLSKSQADSLLTQLATDWDEQYDTIAELLAPAASEARQAQVAELQARIQALCPRHAEPICEGEPPAPEATFIRLQRELVTNLACLFVFVEHPAVEPTNNRSERHLRREAEIRKGARTSKSKAGAHRRSVIMTVLASLQLRISTFTLSAVLTEVNRWLTSGTSLFQQERHDLQPHPPPLEPVG